jgi:hypothetical protein
VLPEFEVLPILCNYLETKAEQPDNASALLFIPSIVYLQCAPLLRGVQSLHKVRKAHCWVENLVLQRILSTWYSMIRRSIQLE